MTYSFYQFPFFLCHYNRFLSKFLQNVFMSVLLGEAIRGRILQSDGIQRGFMIAEGKISKVNYSPCGFSLRDEGSSGQLLQVTLRFLNISKYRNRYINLLVIVFLLLQLQSHKCKLARFLNSRVRLEINAWVLFTFNCGT